MFFALPVSQIIGPCPLLHHLELEGQLLTAANGRQVELPKFPGEPQRRPVLIDVHKELKADNPPKVCQSHVDANRSQLRQGIKRKGSAVWHEAGKGITIEVVSVCGIRGPIRVGIMGCDNLDSSPRLCDPV